MRSLPTYRDWEKWVVAIHDEDGFQLEVLPFPDHRVFTELLWQTVCETAEGGPAAPSLNRPHLRL